MRSLGKPEGSERNFDQWLALQREMQSALEARLREQLEDEPDYLTRYRGAYERGFPAWTGRPLSPGRLTERLLEADIVLMGDFHSLAQSQRSALRLLKRLVRRGRRPALGLEMLPSARQAALDDFLAGRRSAKQLRDLAAEEGFWSFPWRPVQILLDYARYHDLPALALNSQPRRPDRALGQRDRHAARILARQRREEPDRPLFVLFGDFHLAEGHLPAALARELRREGSEARTLRVFQNHEPYYWESLAELGRSPEVLDLAGGEVCVQSATPFVKAQSYLHWLTFHERPHGLLEELLDDPAELHEDLSAEVDVALRRIARFLRIPTLERPAPRVYWIGEADFARRLARESGWEAEELSQVEASLGRGEGCYLPARDLIVLAEIGQNHIAEAAALVLHGRSTAISPRPRSLADDFYLRVLRQALIFLGSKVLNPLRKSRDMSYLLRELHGSEQAPSRHWQRRAELLLDYLEAEERYRRSGDPEGFEPRFFGQDGPPHLELTRSVGRHLGGLLHEALLTGRADVHWLREIWFEPFHLEGSPVRMYLEILDRLGPVREGTRRESERL